MPYKYPPIYLKPEIHNALKIYAARTGRSMIALASEFIRQGLITAEKAAGPDFRHVAADSNPIGDVMP